mmetsp:Transcript_64162/g.198838  ORF Transcript_64162/g.198838 Transcript_64162/m.198838 type:complete len:268 (-) Transcript_64162:718-1521(-)
MPRSRRRSRISASPEASSVRPTSSNSSGALVSTTTTPSSCHCGGRPRSSHVEPSSTTRAGASAFDSPDLLFELPEELARARERQSWPSVPGRPSRRLPVESMLGRRLGPPSMVADCTADLAVVRCLKAWHGYSRILQSSSISARRSSRFSTTKSAACCGVSSARISRVMILRKPRRSSFCWSLISASAMLICTAASSLMLAMRSRSRCCARSCRCHSFCVRRHRERKAMRTRLVSVPSPSPPMFTTSACTISCSLPSVSSTASQAEW